MWRKLCSKSLILYWLLASWTVPLNAQEQSSAPTAQAVTQLMHDQPLSEATWPIWRDYYVRLFFVYDVGEPIEFYEQLHSFIGGIAAQNSDALHGKWAADSVAWIILSKHFEGSASGLELAVAASRQAMALDKNSAMSCETLAGSLIRLVGQRVKTTQLLQDQQLQLDEAEELLQRVDHLCPESRLSFYKGLAKWYRGDRVTALKLLHQGALDHLDHSSYAAFYLSLLASSDLATKPYAETTGIFLKQFPNDPGIQAHHIMALYGDERFSEAYESLQESRQNKLVEQFLGPKSVEAVEEGRWITRYVLEGIKLAKNGSHEKACEEFREAYSRDSENILAAKHLACSLVLRYDQDRSPDPKKLLDETIAECAGLIQRFPDEPELHVTYSGALFRARRNIEAEEELDRAKALGGNLSELAGPLGESQVHQAAEHDRKVRKLARGLLGVLIAGISWLSLMFLLGVVLALCTSRLPNTPISAGMVQTSGEAWLERLYLVVLGISLVFFYVSVPFIALGLFAITVLLFGIMLLFRFVHIGILFRGLFAAWGVIRSAFIGPSNDCLGIDAKREQHPELFKVLDEVADRLDTSPADEVYLTPSSLIGVREQGKGPFGLFRRRRVIEIGVSTLPQLTISDFKSILAHEFGHFSHQDTFFARIISQVTASLSSSMAVMSAAGGEANFVNPFYWFYWLYLRAYMMLASGFSRSREFLADRRAVLAYGKSGFIAALSKVVVNTALFEGSAIKNIQGALGTGQRFVNVFATFREYRSQPELVASQKQLFEIISATKPSWFDSHPTYSERFAALREFPDSRTQVETLLATTLIADITQIEERLTELLTNYVYTVSSDSPAM